MDFNQAIEEGIMRLVSERLSETGLTVAINWDRQDPNVFPDYTGEINGQAWAFEITQLKRPNPKEFRYVRTADDLSKLEKPLSKIEADADHLDQSIKEAIEAKGNPKRTSLLSSDENYCLILVDDQHLYDHDWQPTVASQDYSKFDAVIAVHVDIPFGYENVGGPQTTPVTALAKSPQEWLNYIPKEQDIT